MQTPVLSTEAISSIIGCKSRVPLAPRDMALSLRVAFYPSTKTDEKLEIFLTSLYAVLKQAGVTVISYDDALKEGSNGHVGKGIVLFTAGEGEPENLAIDHVDSLVHNTVVGVHYGGIPALGQNRFQQRVNSLVNALVWHMVHIIIYVDDQTWTICSMNGAIETFSLSQLEERVTNSLIPKLASPVAPLQKSDFTTEFEAFDPHAPDFEMSIHDMQVGASLMKNFGLLASQTKLSELTYRNNKYKRIASAYLSLRTGMSYGFLSRQLPATLLPAIQLENTHQMLQRIDWEEKDFIEFDHYMIIAPKIGRTRYIVRIPQVTVLCTRSGCNKTKFDPTSDLVTLTLSEGRVILGLAKGIPEGSDCQPSFDTLIILAHAVGNCIIAKILEAVTPNSKFSRALRLQGLATAHWHGDIDASSLPAGYYLHGNKNPPVSCSAPQAAIYALTGKLAALEKSILDGSEYLGDAHIEPSHGTNICGRSMKELAWLAAGNSLDVNLNEAFNKLD